MAEGGLVCTIGHSNHSEAAFLALLEGAGIDAVADVRSTPYSRRNPQFNRETLGPALKRRGVAYVWLGEGLGARPADPALRRPDGSVDFERVAASPAFLAAIDRVRDGANRHKVALMCAEREPINCHRTILIARHVAGLSVAIRHILGDGSIMDHEELENEILCQVFPEGRNLFSSSDDPLLDQAYDKLAKKMTSRSSGVG